MKKVRNGIGGELTAEVFETWFPDKPTIILLDFLKTKQSEIICIHKINATDVGITRINREYAKILLNEFRVPKELWEERN